jgi:hypothetical protein
VAIWSAAVLLLPETIGRALLGETWLGTRSVLPWTCAEYLSMGVGAATMLWLRVRFPARPLLQPRLIVAALLGSFGTGAATWVVGPVRGDGDRLRSVSQRHPELARRAEKPVPRTGCIRSGVIDPAARRNP